MTKLSIPVPVILQTTTDAFRHERRSLEGRKNVDRRDFDEVSLVTIDRIDRDDLEELLTIATKLDAKKFVKTLAAVLNGGEESGWKVP
ncbi:hypothetical protein PHISP_08674, partial [Aspergillus sp. HF37]